MYTILTKHTEMNKMKKFLIKLLDTIVEIRTNAAAARLKHVGK
jgi:hypothetical protein